MDIKDLGSDRKRDFLEVIVFLFFIVPSIIFSFFTLESGNPLFPILSCSLIFNDLAYISLNRLLSLAQRRTLRKHWMEIRWNEKEAVLGAGLFLPLMVCVSLIEKGFQYIGMSSHMNDLPKFLAFKGPVDFPVLFLLIIVSCGMRRGRRFFGATLCFALTVTGSLSASVIMSSNFIFPWDTAMRDSLPW